jgi:hypothetical protein
MNTSTKTEIKSYSDWSKSQPTTYALSVLEAGRYWTRNLDDYYSPIEVAIRKYWKEHNLDALDGNIPVSS